MVRSRWIGSVCGFLAWTGLAAGQQPSPAVTATQNERILTVQEPGKPAKKYWVMKSWKRPDGMTEYQVQSLATGQTMTLVQPTATIVKEEMPVHSALAQTIPSPAPAKTPSPIQTVSATQTVELPAPPPSITHLPVSHPPTPSPAPALPPGVTPPASTVDQIITIQEPGKAGQEYRLLKTWKRPDGATAHDVQSLSTGEKMTLIDPAGSNGKVVAPVVPPIQPVKVAPAPLNSTVTKLPEALPPAVASVAVTTPTDATERILTVQGPGKPAEKYRVLKTSKRPDGASAYEVQSLATGETMTLIDPPGQRGTTITITPMPGGTSTVVQGTTPPIAAKPQTTWPSAFVGPTDSTAPKPAPAVPALPVVAKKPELPASVPAVQPPTAVIKVPTVSTPAPQPPVVKKPEPLTVPTVQQTAPVVLVPAPKAETPKPAPKAETPKPTVAVLPPPPQSNGAGQTQRTAPPSEVSLPTAPSFFDKLVKRDTSTTTVVTQSTPAPSKDPKVDVAKTPSAPVKPGDWRDSWGSVLAAKTEPTKPAPAAPEVKDAPPKATKAEMVDASVLSRTSKTVDSLGPPKPPKPADAAPSVFVPGQTVKKDGSQTAPWSIDANEPNAFTPARKPEPEQPVVAANAFQKTPAAAQPGQAQPNGMPPMMMGQGMAYPMPRMDQGAPTGMANAFTPGGTARPIPADFGQQPMPNNAFLDPSTGMAQPMASMPPRPMSPVYPPMMQPPMMQPQATATRSSPIHDPALAQTLAALRDSPLPSQREMAADQLTSFDWRNQPVILSSLLASAKTDPAPSVRAGCVRVVVRMKVGTAEVLAVLQSLKNDRDDGVRLEATQALAGLTSSPAAGDATVRPTGATQNVP